MALQELCIINIMSTLIYWEKQGYDRLCGVHCINSLLQGPFFTEVDLATIAQEIDRQEQELLGGGQFAGNHRSNNVAEDGNFSIQVLAEALKKLGQLTIESIDSQLNQNSDQSNETGFICNSASHWFAIRKVKNVWYNLNSTNRRGPEIISDFYLSAFLMSVRENGYHIFVVKGIWPDGEIYKNITERAQHQLYFTAEQCKALHERLLKKKNYQLNINGSDEQDIQKAMKASLGQKQDDSDDDEEFDDFSQGQQPQKQSQPQHFGGQGIKIMEEKIGSNYDKFLIDQNDIEYYMAITMTLESKFEKVLSEGIVILFQLPDGKSMEWTFPYDATVEDLYDYVFWQTRSNRFQFVLSCPIIKQHLLVMTDQLLELGIDTMTQIVVRKL